MMDWISAWWTGLGSAQRWFIMVAIVAIIVGVLASYIFLDTDYSGVGDWLQSWFN